MTEKMGPWFLSRMSSVQDTDLHPRKGRGWEPGTASLHQQKPLDSCYVQGTGQGAGWAQTHLGQCGQGWEALAAVTVVVRERTTADHGAWEQG